MTPSDVAAYLREYMDLTSSDVSQTLVTRWAQEAQRMIRKARPRWVDLETRLTVTTTAAVDEYPIAALQVVNAVDCTDTGPMAVMDEAQAVARYWDGDGTPSTGRPEAITRYGLGTIKVWPVPDGVYTLRLLGQRPVVSPGATADFDLPDDLEDVAVEWVMHRSYLHQDDPDLAEIHRALFAANLDRWVAEEGRDTDASPLIFGGGDYQSRRRHRPDLMNLPSRNWAPT